MFLHCELLVLILVLIKDGQAVIGTESVTHRKPYMALLKWHLQDGKETYCGGFLLNADFVMTAAHCQGRSNRVLLGVYNFPRENKSPQVLNISVEQTFPHEDYNATNNKNDIMLLKLSSKAKFSNNLRPIPLADQINGSLSKSCSVSRWERKDSNSPFMSDTLMEINVTLTDSEQCAEDFYCSEGGSGQVAENAGGPLVCDGKAYGLVSHRFKPDSGGPEINHYTKIPAYRRWIDSTMKKSLKSWLKESAPHSRPYMVLLDLMQDGKSKHCSGFLLNEDFVMTSAHCRGSSYTVFLGLHNSHKRTEVQRLSVEAAFPHKDFNAKKSKNDMLLLKLSSKAKFNKNVRPIPLADRDDGSLPKSCSVSGWGRTRRDYRKMSDTLIEVNVTLIDSEQCAEGFYCSEGDIGPSRGDAGGPLVCDGKAYGVVSSQLKPASVDLNINRYSKIPGHGSWIDSTMKNALKTSIFFLFGALSQKPEHI